MYRACTAAVWIGTGRTRTVATRFGSVDECSPPRSEDEIGVEGDWGSETKKENKMVWRSVIRERVESCQGGSP